MIMPRYLTVQQAHEVSEVHRIEDDNMSITRSISVAQTDNRVLKANCMLCRLLLLLKHNETVQGKTEDRELFYTERVVRFTVHTNGRDCQTDISL